MNPQSKDQALRARQDLIDTYGPHADEQVRRAQLDRFQQSLAGLAEEALEGVVEALGLRGKSRRQPRLAMLLAVRKDLEKILKIKEVQHYDR